MKKMKIEVIVLAPPASNHAEVALLKGRIEEIRKAKGDFTFTPKGKIEFDYWHITHRRSVKVVLRQIINDGIELKAKGEAPRWDRIEALPSEAILQVLEQLL